MRKIIYLTHMSLDGMVADSHAGMDWVDYNDEVQKFAHEAHSMTDAAIYGRVTFQIMESYWPGVLRDPTSQGGELAHAQWADKATKYVFSKTLKSSDWNNTVIIHDNIAEEVKRIKEQPGKDIWMLASPTLAQEFMRLGLIDEYWFTVTPVILGSGKFLFAGLDKKINLKLLECRNLKGKVMGLRYEPAGAS